MSTFIPWIHSVGGGGSLPTTVTVPVSFTIYLERNTRQLDQQAHGMFNQVVTGDTVASGDSPSFTNGLGKLLIVINAGADISGTLNVAGTQINRNTGVEAAGNEDISIDALTTDDSDTDADGNIRHAFTGAYITSSWYKGSVTLSTTDLDISDFDVWNVAFEQVNDTESVVATTLDASLYATNATAWFYAYEYLLDVDTTTKKCDVNRIASLELPAADVGANLAYRLRKGNINQAFNGTSDGFFLDMHFGPNNQQYWINVTIKAWFDIVQSLA